MFTFANNNYIGYLRIHIYLNLYTECMQALDLLFLDILRVERKSFTYICIMYI